MRITEINIYPLYTKDINGKVMERGENNNTLIELKSECGISGYGSTYTTYALTCAAMKLIGPVIIGDDDIVPARVSEHLHQRNFWFGRGGSVTHVISGVDIAMWDLYGKTLGVSVSRLIGGRYRNSIRPYASLTFTDKLPFVPKIEEVVEKGFVGIKMGWGTLGRLDMKNDENVVAECRRAAGKAALMIDAGGSGTDYNVTYKRALETSKMMRNYDVEWYEEALRPDDIEGFIKLREHSPVRISSCEVLTRRQAFMPWIERGAVDIIQPDATKVGGLTEFLRIVWNAYDHGIDFVGHGYNTVFGVAADLQLAAALPNAEWVEYITPTPLLEDLTAEPFKIIDGHIEIPDGPGLGIEPDMEKVKFYSARGT
jgi:L-alanine-DL-glutamate epimerase-like enolase superfamily enzyme